MEEIKQSLLKKQAQIDQQLQSIDDDDPIIYLTIAESLEVGAEAWEAETHAKVLALKNNLIGLSSQIKHSLQKIHLGTYGECEKCHNLIEEKRLKALPSATLCHVCASAC